MLCQYKDIFGKPHQGMHSYRIGPFAAVDLLATLVAALIIGFILKTSITQTILIFAALWVLGVIFHAVFCVSTPLTRLLK